MVTDRGRRSRIQFRILKGMAAVLLALVLISAGYFIYVFASWHRIGDQDLTVEGNAAQTVREGKEYLLMSWNIGFGAYEADYGFFMDGGTQSWAWSKERLTQNLAAIADTLAQEKADFYLLQEVDTNSTRSYHVDERVPIQEVLPGDLYQSVFAQNYDSPFLFYPLLQPHGASRSGLLTLSSCGVESAFRKELPIETGLIRLLDLDRCYSISRIPVENGKELVLYNLHLSAYTSDGTIATEQLRLLIGDMQAEYEAGNYCIAGGDFNKDLLGDSGKWFGEADRDYTWAQPIPEETFDGTGIVLVTCLDEAAPVPSCRNADSAYHEGQYVLTVDGFMVSDNIKVIEDRVMDTGFAFSDHNPVTLRFALE